MLLDYWWMNFITDQKKHELELYIRSFPLTCRQFSLFLMSLQNIIFNFHIKSTQVANLWNFFQDTYEKEMGELKITFLIESLAQIGNMKIHALQCNFAKENGSPVWELFLMSQRLSKSLRPFTNETWLNWWKANQMGCQNGLKEYFKLPDGKSVSWH